MTDKQLSDREIKALQIAAKSKLTQKGNEWLVPSQAGHGEYEVRPDPQAPRCTCPDFEFRNAKCKHVLAVEYTLMRETTSDGQTVVTETTTVTRKTWKASNYASDSREIRNPGIALRALSWGLKLILKRRGHNADVNLWQTPNESYFAFSCRTGASAWTLGSSSTTDFFCFLVDK